MKVSQSLDIVISCLLFPLCLTVRSSVVALRTLVVLGAWLLRMGANHDLGSPRVPR
jgi:hypothetical protein